MPSERRPLWILAIPIAVLAMGGIIWAVLAGMPFGTPDTSFKDGRSAAASGAAAQPDTIAEGTAGTSTVSQIGEPEGGQPTAQPAPVAPPPPSNPPMASSVNTITEADATSRLRDYLLSTSNIDSACLGIRSLGYKNVGYTLDAVDTCATDSNGSLGRWRVDAITREVFKQNENGKYVRP